MQPEVWLDRLIDAELADRQVRSLRCQLKAARFPAHRDLAGIDWTETPLPQAQISQLASAAFMQTAHNLILVGGTGTGKTHVATAGAVEEQSVVTQEMSTAMQATAGNVAAINDNMVEITAAVQQVGQAVSDTRNAAQVLVR